MYLVLSSGLVDALKSLRMIGSWQKIQPLKIPKDGGTQLRKQLLSINRSVWSACQPKKREEIKSICRPRAIRATYLQFSFYRPRYARHATPPFTQWLKKTLQKKKTTTLCATPVYRVFDIFKNNWSRVSFVAILGRLGVRMTKSNTFLDTAKAGDYPDMLFSGTRELLLKPGNFSSSFFNWRITKFLINYGWILSPWW